MPINLTVYREAKEWYEGYRNLEPGLTLADCYRTFLAAAEKDMAAYLRNEAWVEKNIRKPGRKASKSCGRKTAVFRMESRK